MKKIIFILSILFIASCSNTQQVVLTAKKDNRGNLIGTSDKKLLQENYSWFTQKYNNYTPNTQVIKQLKPLLRNVTIKAFMGTWCGDSKRETPPFYKIIDAAGFKEKNITMVAMNRSKRYNGMEKTYNVRRVPTFIFYKKDKEIGRIVERRGARQSFEKDILNILSK